MKRSDMVADGAKLLLAAERSTDSAYVDAAALAGGLVQMRLDSRLSAVIGQDVVDDVSAAILKMGEARAALVRAHNGLTAVKVRIGCGAVATGGEDKHDHNDAFGMPPLEVVGRKAA